MGVKTTVVVDVRLIRLRSKRVMIDRPIGLSKKLIILTSRPQQEAGRRFIQS